MVSEDTLEVIAIDTGDYAKAVDALGRDSLFRDLLLAIAEGFNDLAEDAVNEIKQGILGMFTQNKHLTAPGLRETVSNATFTDTTVKDREVHTVVAVNETPEARGFRNAPAALNSPSGWDHPVFGFGSVHQIGQPGYFSDVLEDAIPDFDSVVEDALQDFMDTLERASR